MTNIRSLSRDELMKWVTDNGYPSYRATQIYGWLWKNHVSSFAEMQNIPKVIRQKMIEQFSIQPIRLDLQQVSSDGTIKYRFALHEGHNIESVLIPVSYDDRYTVCVSTQVGCSLACKFCATGQMERIRNLDAGEIVDQVVKVQADCESRYNHRLTNIVYMGMGEPLLNYKETLRSIDRITSPDGMDWSPRRITVSTAGIAKMIRKLADDKVKFNLALSLHAANDLKRNSIMPINETNTLESLMDALDYFYKETGNRISYEYIAFDGFNDSIYDARELNALCHRFPVNVNIIEYNSIDGFEGKKSPKNQLDKFAKYLEDRRVTVTIRRSRGKDIDAACGQLANKDS